MGWVKRAVTYPTHLRLLAVLLFGLMPPAPLISQLITSDISQYSHKAWLTQDGAVVGNTQSITQTKDGYLWIGSAFGLQRFDGINFTFASPMGEAAWQKPKLQAFWVQEMAAFGSAPPAACSIYQVVA